MSNTLHNLRKNNSGSSAAEYALMIAFAGIAGAAATTLGGDLATTFRAFSTKLTASSTACSYPEAVYLSKTPRR